MPHFCAVVLYSFVDQKGRRDLRGRRHASQFVDALREPPESGTIGDVWRHSVFTTAPKASRIVVVVIIERQNERRDDDATKTSGSETRRARRRVRSRRVRDPVPVQRRAEKRTRGGTRERWRRRRRRNTREKRRRWDRRKERRREERKADDEQQGKETVKGVTSSFAPRARRDDAERGWCILSIITSARSRSRSRSRRYFGRVGG